VTLSAGSRLGPYEILAPAGAGGMGEVYKARDTRLERTVAIKVLPAHLSQTPEGRQRFEREAKTISQLSHPHICALHDVGHQDGTEYLVMEFLEGETLTDRLARGPLPLEQALRFGIEIADALDKAHRQGVIHRDLKPGNVMLTKSGVKLVDFGLAKFSAASSPGSSGVTSFPTQGPGLTAEGTILGTFQYMAPEQLEGKEADARTDIFAFGAVLYEMVTGEKAFSGKSQASLIGAILHTQPAAISAVQPLSPPALDRVVARCLAKDPEDRWQTAHDAMLELKWIAAGSGSQAGLPAPTAQRKSREKTGWLVAGLLLLSLLGAIPFLVRGLGSRTAKEHVLKLSIVPPEKTLMHPGHFAISPDGRRLAFVAVAPDGRSLLWVRSLDSLEAKALPGTENAAGPFWSPDSRFVGFFAEQKLKKIEAAGGPPLAICDASNGRGGTWNREGVIVFAPTPTTALHRVSADGGESTPITTLDDARQENSHRHPHFLPDGRHFLYYVRSYRPENRTVCVGSLDSKETRRLAGPNSPAVFVPPGFLIFVREEGALVARRFDPKRMELSGDPILIADRVRPFDSTAPNSFSVADDGTLVIGTGGTAARKLVWLDRAGQEIGSTEHRGVIIDLRLSPDQTSLALDHVDPDVGGRQIWIQEFARGVTARFAFGAVQDVSPVWSPDGRRIAFGSDRGGAARINQIYVKASSGAGSEELLFRSADAKFLTDWSRDGRFLLFEVVTPPAATRTDLWTLPLDGAGGPRPYLATAFNESLGRFSPDGRWVAYTSDETGKNEVYVQSFPVSTGKWKVSSDGGSQPVWRGDGRELFFLSRTRQIHSVSVTPGGATFAAGPPRALFPTPPFFAAGTGSRFHYDVTPDGGRFLVARSWDSEAGYIVHVLVDWTAELEKTP
jgi:serine/threonine protein kinase/Tol biopolymer transport system component